MDYKKYRTKTAVTIMLVVAIITGLFVLQGILFIEKDRILKEGHVLWQAENPAIEKELKDYIDNIDWLYYSNQVIEVVTNSSNLINEIICR